LPPCRRTSPCMNRRDDCAQGPWPVVRAVVGMGPIHGTIHHSPATAFNGGSCAQWLLRPARRRQLDRLAAAAAGLAARAIDPGDAAVGPLVPRMRSRKSLKGGAPEPMLISSTSISDWHSRSSSGGAEAAAAALGAPRLPVERDHRRRVGRRQPPAPRRAGRP